MSLLFSRQQRALGDSPSYIIPTRGRYGSVGSVAVTNDSALTSSAVWACQRLRADLISTLPVRTFKAGRNPDGSTVKVDTEPTPFLLDPAGDKFGVADWLYSTQFELDRSGNVFGLIRAVDGLGKPSIVELVDIATVVVKGRGPRITGYRIGGTDYTPDEVWHERAFTVPGVPLGLSPMAYAQIAVGTHLSAQQFAVDWFRNGAIPSGQLKNTAKTLKPGEADVAKQRFKVAVENRDVFVHGADWEYSAVQITANESQFLDTMKFSINDVSRFFGVPGDLIDAPTASSASITYANITQRHLQLLVINLNPTVVRRERALSATLAAPRFVELDTEALLRMDPQTLSTMQGQQVRDRLRAPSEVRGSANLAPYTAEQMAEFNELFGKQPPPGSMSTGVPA